MEEASATSEVHTPLAQSSSSALAVTGWTSTSTLVTTVGTTASGNVTWGSSGGLAHPSATGIVPVSAGSKVSRAMEGGWDMLVYMPVLAVGIMFI